jgi:hypothetical protein
MFRAAVPKASVHEDADTFLSENKIGTAGELLLPPPTQDSVRAENLDQAKLGCLVAL